MTGGLTRNTSRTGENGTEIGLGIETMVSIWPQVDWRSEIYEEMKQQGLLVKINAGIDVQMDFHGNNVFMDADNRAQENTSGLKCRKTMAHWAFRRSGWMRRSQVCNV